MTKINWKLRLKNKATLLALVLVIIAFVYEVFAIVGVVPSVTEDSVVQLAKMIIEVMAMLGIVIDPTTSGISDSDQAMEYTEPKG